MTIEFVSPFDCSFKEEKPEIKIESKKSSIILRDYQQEACDVVLKDLQEYKSALLVLATGLGKTVIFSKIISEWTGRVLVLVDREELLQQAYRTIGLITGEILGIERAGEYGLGERVIVATIQTIHRKLNKFKPNHFSLIIVDEAHVGVSDSYFKVFEHFTDAKRIGLTATDYRSDGRQLPYDVCSYRMDIKQGIDRGYLVPVKGRRIVIDSIDLTRVKRKGKNGEGDFDEESLDEEMLKGASAIADVIANDWPFSKGILFFPSCASAKLTSECLNRRLTDCSVYIDGKIKGQERKILLDRLRGGDANWLCNVDIAGRGFDWPEATVVGMCAPTLSRAVYVQRAGRGTRPLENILNGFTTPRERLSAIAKSSKPSMMILDFVGISANLNLINHENFISGNDEIETFGNERDSRGLKVVETNEKQGDDLPEILSGEPGPRFDNFRGIAGSVQSRTLYKSEQFEPIDGQSESNVGALFPKYKTDTKSSLLSEKQYTLLKKFGIDDKLLSAKNATKIISVVSRLGFRQDAKTKGIARKLYADLSGSNFGDS